MIVEQLFTANSEIMATGQPIEPAVVSSISRNFTGVVENVIYYTSGYVIKNCCISIKHALEMQQKIW